MLFTLFIPSSFLVAQLESVRPDINKSFNDATEQDLPKFVERFEKEGREVYDHRDEIIAKCELRPAMTVADIGAGTGLFTRLIAPKVAEVIAVDINQEFLDHIKTTAEADGIKNVRTLLCDQNTTNLKPNSIDVAFICDTYHHFEFPYRTMRSVRNALKPDGVLVLVEFDRIEGKSSEWMLNHMRAGRETFTKEIEIAGFEETMCEDEMFETSYMKKFRKAEQITEKGHTTDSLDDVKFALANGSAVLIDVREQSEWDEGHLSDAKLVPMSELNKIADEKAALLKKLPADQIVYTHCRRGGRAAKVGNMLRKQGYDVRAISSGFEDLVKEGFEKAEDK
jgi:rhodanese-related sulfurtransferase/2-polyprenyl-3-methyl-5-hydroxy-6-metoxy-1,4-benzoquinol methylase